MFQISISICLKVNNKLITIDKRHTLSGFNYNILIPLNKISLFGRDPQSHFHPLAVRLWRNRHVFSCHFYLWISELEMIRDFEHLSIRVVNGKLEVLDQKKLPTIEEWLPCDTIEQMYTYIFELSVRGGILLKMLVSYSPISSFNCLCCCFVLIYLLY
jgi:hypothetical protein